MLSQDSITKAWFFASNAHNNQLYPGSNLPYITHIGNVVLELSTISLEDKNLAICCAILHDTIEDTDVTYEDIKKEFGQKVANGVAALTKNKSLPKSKQMIDSLERIVKEPKEVWAVKLADRITNLSSPPSYWSLEKRKNYQKEALLIYEYLHSSNRALANRLKEKIENYNKYLKG